jgi:hypothetical protein
MAKRYNDRAPDYATLAKPKPAAAPAKAKGGGGLNSLMGNASDYMNAPRPSAPAPKPVSTSVTQAAPRAAAKPAAKAAPKPKATGYSAETKAWAAQERAGIAAQRAKAKPAAKPKAKSNRGYDSYKKLMD